MNYIKASLSNAITATTGFVVRYRRDSWAMACITESVFDRIEFHYLDFAAHEIAKKKPAL